MEATSPLGQSIVVPRCGHSDAQPVVSVQWLQDPEVGSFLALPQGQHYWSYKNNWSLALILANYASLS